MGLGLNVGGASGDRMPYVKYDARAGRWFRVDRTETGGQWTTNSVDITNDFSAVFDMAGIKVGWISYSDQGPAKAMVPLGQSLPARPQGTDPKGRPAFNQGFDLTLALSTAIGGGVREFNSNARIVIEAISELHDAYERSPESKTGKMPVVAMEAAVPVKSGQSTNYKPVLKITGWVDRPAALVVAQQPAPAAATFGVPPSTGSTQAPPPPAREVPQPATADAMSFG